MRLAKSRSILGHLHFGFEVVSFRDSVDCTEGHIQGLKVRRDFIPIRVSNKDEAVVGILEAIRSDPLPLSVLHRSLELPLADVSFVTSLSAMIGGSNGNYRRLNGSLQRRRANCR